MKNAIFAVGLAVALLPGAAMACTCVEPPLEEAVAQSKYVYIGTVMSGRQLKGEIFQVESIIQAIRIGKGQMSIGTRTVTMGGNMCNSPLAVGQTYALFENEAGRVDAICGGPGVIHRSREDEFIRKVKDVAGEQ